METSDAIELLEEQHRAVERLLDDLSQGGPGAEARPKLLELADLVTTHAAIEEQHFYPAVRTAETEGLIQESFHDHLEAKRVLLHLLDVGPEDPDFTQELEDLQGLIAAHVGDEEAELFPRARELLDADQLEGLAQQMTARMVELQEGGPPHERLALDLAEAPAPTAS